MPKFAVYYVPQAEDDFYRLGTSILGYDVRARGPVSMPRPLQERLGGYNPDWGKAARPYGFHLTIGDAIDFALDDVLAIEREIDEILKCFAPRHTFSLQRREDDFVTFWGQRQEVVVLRYNPNPHLTMLHTLIVARVNPLGTGSGYLQKYLQDPAQYVHQPHQAQRIKKFYSPTVLDSYAPHFTLLNPYSGQDHARLARVFSEMFGRFSSVTLGSVCLLLKLRQDKEWEIHREFKLLNG